MLVVHEIGFEPLPPVSSRWHKGNIAHVEVRTVSFTVSYTPVGTTYTFVWRYCGVCPSRSLRCFNTRHPAVSGVRIGDETFTVRDVGSLPEELL